MSAFAENSETRSFTTCDGSLAYRDVGEGRPLVLLHAGFFDHSMWDEQIRAFAPHYRVIAPDARGHGASSNATRPFRPADDLAALLRHLDVGPAVLVGVSMGGGTAVDTALEHPELVRAVVVCGVGTSEPYFENPWSLMAERLVRAVHDGRAVSVENTAHFPNMEAPTEFNALLARFLETLPN
ncbi:alpha/beta hydrolase [Streptomyces sp. MC1]|uniref:alpha/beta fold hydrolase n=1 Tax=Streptomyces sp. MC1 TaxID=295105 RepID=UPI0018C9531B|nr:alpha/beta hydrolase [Streptomyces sp. MC1]MBG7697666.1 alpha/beta hydrolase [Streptomyces sp. MC1]